MTSPYIALFESLSKKVVSAGLKNARKALEANIGNCTEFLAKHEKDLSKITSKVDLENFLTKKGAL